MDTSRSIYRASREYAARIRAFRPNARLYLLSVLITGAALGVFRLLFNFYVLSLGFDEALLGRLITISSLTAMLAALPMGYLADIFGRKASLVLSGALVSLSVFAMVLWPYQGVFYAMNVVSGIAQSLAAVTMAPFLMENSGEEERTYLFSISAGLQMAMASVGNWIGGYLPTWVSGLRDVSPTSSTAYAGALLVIAIIAGAGVIPLLFLHTRQLDKSERSVFAPLSYAYRHPGRLSKLILPIDRKSVV